MFSNYIFLNSNFFINFFLKFFFYVFSKFLFENILKKIIYLYTY